MIDEYTRECLVIRVARRLGSYEVIEALADVMLWRGVPENIASCRLPLFVGSAFDAKFVQLRKQINAVCYVLDFFLGCQEVAVDFPPVFVKLNAS